MLYFTTFGCSSHWYNVPTSTELNARPLELKRVPADQFGVGPYQLQTGDEVLLAPTIDRWVASEVLVGSEWYVVDGLDFRSSGELLPGYHAWFEGPDGEVRGHIKRIRVGQVVVDGRTIEVRDLEFTATTDLGDERWRDRKVRLKTKSGEEVIGRVSQVRSGGLMVNNVWYDQNEVTEFQAFNKASNREAALIVVVVPIALFALWVTAIVVSGDGGR